MARSFSTNDVSDSMATFHMSLDEIQGYDIWIKLVMPDGSKTAWSRKVTVQNQLVERVDVEAVSDFIDATLHPSAGILAKDFNLSKSISGSPGPEEPPIDKTESQNRRTN